MGKVKKTVAKVKTTKAVAKQQTPQSEMQLLITQAVENKLPVETLEKLLDLRDRVKSQTKKTKKNTQRTLKTARRLDIG